MDKLTITRPDDRHLRLRDVDVLRAVLPDTTRRFARAIVMPNLTPPVTTVAQAAAYRERIVHAGIVLHAETFEAAGALDRLAGFASHFGADCYGLPRNTQTVTLVREAWPVPKELPMRPGDPLIPLRAGETIAWRLAKSA